MKDARRTCREWEPALALYVEGDLPAGEVPALEAHLAQCAECRELLCGLGETQAALHRLADEIVEEAALDAVRTRVRSRLARPRAIVWRWVAAASVFLVAGLVIVGMVGRQGTSSGPAVVVVPTTTPAAPEVLPTPAPQPSAARHAAVARSRASASNEAETTPEEPDVPLTSEEVDQLVRAIVLLSRIETLADLERETAPPDDRAAEAPPAATVRLATADPNVVIYWQFESNGG